MISLKQIWTKSIARQLMLGIALVHAVLMTIFVIDLVAREKNFLIELSEKQAIGLAETLAANGTSWVLAQDFVGMEEIINSQSGFPGLKYAMFLDTKGKVLAYTDINQVGKYIDDETSKMLFKAKPEPHSLVDNSRFIDIAAPIMASNQQIGWARVGISREGITDNIRHVTQNGLIYTFAAILIGTIFAWFMGRGLTRGLFHLSQATHCIAEGKQEVICKLDRQDELGALSDDFNKMQTIIRELIGEIKEREQNLAITLNSIGDGVIATDNKGHITRMNPAAERMTGWLLKDAMGQLVNTIFPIINATTREPIENLPEKVISSGEVIHLSKHATLISRDGTEYQIADSAAPICDEDKNVLGMVLIFNDISEQYQLRKAKEESEKRLADSQEMAHIGNWELDLVKNELNWSDEIYRIFEIDKEKFDASYEAFLNTIHPDDREAVNTAYMASLKNKKAYSINHRLRMADNRIKYVIEQCKTFYDEAGNPLISTGTVQDITEQVNLENTLRRTQKMDALGKLTGGIAHDYNNMLGIILGYADLLESALGEGDQPELAQYANEIHHAGERGVRLTKKLLSFSRQKASEANSLNLNSLLLNEQHMLEKTLTVRIKLVLELAEDLWKSWLDDSEMEDAILNICINAMHAIEGNGLLTISTSNEQLNQMDAQLLALTPGDYVLLSITDTGCGMDEETREKIFEPFFSTKGKRGTGLGLSQVYGFVHSSGGAIKVYSELGHGSRFALYFPRYYGSDSEEYVEEENNVVDIKGTETILIVDDEPALLSLSCTILERHDFNVITAESGKQALDILEHETVDLIISDIIMPEMDGYQLAAIVKEKYPDIKIQLASGFADERNMDMVDKDLQQNLLLKPFNSHALLKRIKTLLEAK